MPNKVYRYKMKTLCFTILTITYPTHLTRKMPREPGGERRRNQLDSSALEIKPKKTWRIKIVHHLNRILSEVKKKSRMRNLYFLQEMLPNVFATQLSWNEIPTNYIHGVASAQWGNTGGSRSCLVTCSLLLSSRIKNEEKSMLSGLSKILKLIIYRFHTPLKCMYRVGAFWGTTVHWAHHLPSSSGKLKDFSLSTCCITLLIY